MLPQLLQAYTLPNTHTIVPEIEDDSHVEGLRKKREEKSPWY